jgi:hypothetical protein
MALSWFLNPRLNDAPADEVYSLWWNQILTWISCFNFVLLCRYVLWPRWIPPALTFASSAQINQHFWSMLHRHQYALSAIYVVACGIRAIWPRMDGDRCCFYDSSMSLVIVGRSLAMVAELSYCAQLCIALVAMSGRTLTANRLFLLNICAQACCWYSVLTQDQRGHVLEESLWTLTGITVTYQAFKIVITKASPMFSPSFSTPALSFAKAALCAGPIYVAFMLYVDLPMYWGRHAIDRDSGKVFMSLAEGWADVQRCAAVSQKDVCTPWEVVA